MSISKANFWLLLKLLLVPVVIISLYGYFHMAFNFGFNSLKHIIFFSIEYASIISGYFVLKHIIKYFTKNKQEKDIYKTVKIVFSCVIIASGYLTFNTIYFTNLFYRMYVLLLPTIIILNLLYSVVNYIKLKKQ